MTKHEQALALIKDFSDRLKDLSDDKNATMTALVGVYSVVKRESYFLHVNERDGLERDAEKVATVLIRRREELLKRDKVSDETLEKVIRAMACAFEKEKTE